MLGTHVIDLVPLLAGDVTAAWERVTKDGHDLGPEDVIEGAEGMGASGGNFVLAHYAFENDVSGTFESWHHQGSDTRLFGLTLYGTNDILSFRGSPGDAVFFLPRPAPMPGGDVELESNVTELPADSPATCERPGLSHNQKASLDLIAAVEAKRESVSGGVNGRSTLGVIAAGPESHRLGQHIPFPLANRENSFETLRYDE